MKYLKTVLPAMLLALTTNVSAITYTFGNLTSDDTTNFIKDTVTGRKYLRFDTLNLSYADTLTAVGAGGMYEGWSIATSGIADEFYNAILGVDNSSCTGDVVYGSRCGTISGWSDGAFGNSYKAEDIFWYLSDSPTSEVGFGNIDYIGRLADYEPWNSISASDTYLDIDFLVYRDDVMPSTVPAPAAAWLFGSALLGFFGFSRRKANA